MRPLLPILLAIALPAVLTAAEPAAWRVVSVHDGDTLTALDPANVQHKVRLTGIDAPEIGQPFGTKAAARPVQRIVRVYDGDICPRRSDG